LTNIVEKWGEMYGAAEIAAWSVDGPVPERGGILMKRHDPKKACWSLFLRRLLDAKKSFSLVILDEFDASGHIERYHGCVKYGEHSVHQDFFLFLYY
jgi:hypothetical protein